MSLPRLMKKYGVSPGQLQEIFERLSILRKKRIDTMVEDLDYGMSPTDFMRKYRLTLGGLVRVLKTLIVERIATKSASLARRSDSDDSAGGGAPWLQKTEPAPVRLLPRNLEKFRRI